MIIPHLHFAGDCAQAVALYEKAFDTKAHILVTNEDFGAPGGGIAHCEMLIHGQRIMLNDRFGKTDTKTEIAMNLVVTFPDAQPLKDCYGLLGEGGTVIDEMAALSYTECAVQFIDRFGVQWCLMVE